MYTIDLVRHAESDWVKKAKAATVPLFGGSMPDIPLSRDGVEEAKEFGRFAKHEGIKPTLIIFSPYRRTRQTHELSSEQAGWLDVPSYEDKRLREMTWGSWEGGPRSAATSRAVLRAREQSGYEFCPPGGESYAGVRRRAQAALRDAFLRVPPHSHVLAHVHRNVIKALVYPFMAEWTPLNIMDKGPDVVSITRLVYGGDKLRLVFYNQPTLKR